MPTLQQLREEREAADVKIGELIDLCKTDNRDLSDDDRKSFDDWEADIKRLTGDIDRKQSDDERIARYETRAEENKKLSRRASQSGASTRNPPGVRVVNECAQDDPKKGFKSPREFILSVMNAGRGFGEDKRLASLNIKNLAVGSDEQSTFSDPYGGFLVPEAFSPDFLTLQPENDPVTGRTRMVPMELPVINIGARTDKTHTTSVSGGLTVSRRDESGTIAATRMEMEQVKLTATSLFGMSYVTEELLHDSPTSFAALLESGFRQEFQSHILSERFDGTGVGEFEGMASTPCLIEITKEDGQATTTLVYENIINMRSRSWGYGNAIWLANHDTLPQLMLMNQSVGTGGTPVRQPSALEDHPDILLGRPLFFTEYAKSVGTTGDIYLANFNECLEGLYQPLESDESTHVRFVNHERVFKFWLRNASRWWWRAALTPKNGSSLSPVVRVATRA